ncbi:MAG: ABC transporter substrate-binding protein [Austwickia sp.]|nr:ABC transporter substrate-binding protein [Austwickia sp.]
MPRVLPVVAAVLALGAGLAGCGGSSDGRPSTQAAGEGGYPVKLVNCGRNLALAQAPQRVVVMNTGSVAEVSTMLELGVQRYIVANAQDFGVSDVPGRAAAIAALPKGGVTLNALQDIPRAAMLQLKPDLVLSNTDAGFAPGLGFATRDDLAAIGANTYTPPHQCPAPGDAGAVVTPTMEDSYTMLRDLGLVFAASERAEAHIAESKRRIAAVQAKIKGRTPKNVLIAMPGYTKASTGDFAYVAAHGVWNDVLAKAGGVNPFDDPAGAATVVPQRAVLAKAKVDAVIFMNYRNPNPAKTVQGIFLAYPGWEASKRKRYVALADSLYLGPSNHVAVERIARLLHPEAF